MNGPVNGLVHIAVVEDDVRALTAELKTGLLEVGLCGSLENLAANDGAASESDLFYVHVVADGVSDGGAVAVNNVDNTWWETGFKGKLRSKESGEGSELGWLEDDGVSRSQSRAELPRKHHHWDTRL